MADSTDPIDQLAALSESGFNSIQGDPGEDDSDDDAPLDYASDDEESGSSDGKPSDSEDKSGDETDDKTDEEPDYKAKFEESQKTIQELEHKVSSQAGRDRAQQSRDSELEGLKNELAATNKMVAAFVSAQSPDSTIDLGQELSKIGEERASQQRTAVVQAQYSRVAEALAHASHDESDNLLLTESQVGEIRKSWTDAQKTLEASNYMDWSGYTETVLTASRMATAAERSNLKRQEEAAKAEEQKQAKERKQERDESGDGELDIGGPRGNPGVSLDNLSSRELIEKGMASDKKSPLFV